jgi:hypothetical protein
MFLKTHYYWVLLTNIGGERRNERVFSQINRKMIAAAGFSTDDVTEKQ